MSATNRDDPKNTSAIRMIAQDVVEQHAQVCRVKMDNIETQVGKLTEAISSLTRTVHQLTTEVEMLKQRWQIFAVLSALVSVTAILIAFFK